MGDDIVRLLRHVHAVPAGEAARVAPELGHSVTRSADVVRLVVATAARRHGVTDAKFVRVLDELHGGTIVVGVDELHVGVLRPKPADLAAQRLVMPLGEVVEPPEAPVLVVVRAVVALVPAQVRRHAPDGEVIRDHDRLRAHTDELLQKCTHAIAMPMQDSIKMTGKTNVHSTTMTGRSTIQA